MSEFAHPLIDTQFGDCRLRGFADCPPRHTLTGAAGGMTLNSDTMIGLVCDPVEGDLVVRGRFRASGLELERTFARRADGALTERIRLLNPTALPVRLDRLDIGFVADLDAAAGWRLCAVPFRVQLDGSVHDYDAEALRAGTFRNAVYTDTTRPEPALVEDGVLRSEAWVWHDGRRGLLMAKYNAEAVELSVARPYVEDGCGRLLLGGAGFSLYGEPAAARRLEPGGACAFGETWYIPYAGGIEEGYAHYRALLDSLGHGLPGSYDPPLNWNVLYDVGWHHSNREALRRHYTLPALCAEAAKARDCGCELLYLDPGWETAEGLTHWDGERLGPVAEFARMCAAEGLALGFRTILRTYAEHWPAEWLVRHAPDAEPKPVKAWYGGDMWEPCLCNPTFRAEKLRRIAAIVRAGDVRFLMVDEMDWRGPCHAGNHGHPVPSSPMDHIDAVLELCAALRRQFPDLLIECHDPVWPWFACRYLPTYFGQGFAPDRPFQENWGFEYMWNCVNDLKTGRALALYYYNLGCNVPLYLHITMAADNDHAVFFWWAASTVRHLGVGGKYGHPTVAIQGELPSFDPERRFALYRDQVALYRRLKPYFTRGEFHGLGEHAHLHTLSGQAGGVLVVFNISEAEAAISVSVPTRLLRAANLPVQGADSEWHGDRVVVRAHLPAMAPRVVCIGVGRGTGSAIDDDGARAPDPDSDAATAESTSAH
jgi:hypothetical protein